MTGRPTASAVQAPVAGAGRGTLLGLMLVAFVAQVTAASLPSVRAEVGKALGVGPEGISGLVGLQSLASGLVALAVGAWSWRATGRHRPAFGAMTVLSAAALLVASTAPAWAGVAAAWSLGSAATGVAVLLPAAALAAFPPPARVRVLTLIVVAQQLGLAVVAGLVVLLPRELALTWRAGLLLAGVSAALAAAAALPLLRRTWLAVDIGADGVDGDLRFLEAVRRGVQVPTVRALLVAYVLVGMVTVPLPGRLASLLRERHGVSDEAVALALTAVALAVVVGLLVARPRGERAWQADPGAAVGKVSRALAGGGAAVLLAPFAPNAALAVVGVGVAATAIGLALPVLSLTLMTCVAPRLRVPVLVLAALATGLLGGAAGGLLLGGLDRRFGIGVALAALGVPTLLAARHVGRAGQSVVADQRRTIEEAAEAVELAATVRAGARIPMLTCRDLDFSYGQLQVLFSVDLSVDEGEMVALLGTNGAGKSTLLRVISGLGLPSRGSVRFCGQDITYVDAERRLPLGIALVPGGRAVFGRLTVHENLRLIGYSLGRDRRAVDERIDECFAQFPRLAERRHQRASTLSGGEQQMLGVSKAFLVRPRLLLIDELSLGLAPKVVSELLTMVRRINAAGTAVVLVEQSVNVALSVVQHAYFMERGQIRFDGWAADLLERGDLLRSVFLKGASDGLAEHATATTGGPR